MSEDSRSVREALAVYAPEAPETERVPQGYKQTEAGVIPDDWETRPLGEIGKFKNGINKAKEDFGHGTPFVNLLDVFGVVGISNNHQFGLVSASALERDLYDLLEGDILFIRSSVKPAGVGLTTLVRDDLIGTVFSGFLIRFRENDNLDQGFKEHCFKETGFRNRLIASSTVSANTNINQATLKSLQLAYPPDKQEQRAIATALSDVDALISSLDRLISKKRAVKTAAMQQLLTGKQRLPGFSGEWEEKRLDEVADVDSDPLTADTDPNYEFKYISLDDVDMGTLRGFSHQRFSSAPSRARRRVRAGDVLVSTVRPNLKSHLLFSVSEGNWVCSTGFSLVRCRKRLASPGFIYQHLFHGVVPKQIEALIAGSNYPAISARDVRAFQIPMPDVEEQIAIAGVLSDMDAEIGALEARREKTRRIKAGMMQELLTGRTRLV